MSLKLIRPFGISPAGPVPQCNFSTTAFDWKCELCGWSLPKKPTVFPDRIINRHRKAHGLGPRCLPSVTRFGDDALQKRKLGGEQRRIRLERAWEAVRPSYAHKFSGVVVKTPYPNGAGHHIRYKCSECKRLHTATGMRSFPCFAASGCKKPRDPKSSHDFRRKCTIELRSLWNSCLRDETETRDSERRSVLAARCRTPISPALY